MRDSSDRSANEDHSAGWGLSSLSRDATRRDAYIGAGIGLAGVALGVVGLALFLYSGTYPPGSGFFWALRRGTLVSTMLVVPAVATAVAVLFPVGRRTGTATVAGVVLCLGATGWLATVYPYAWTAAGNDVPVVVTYLAGAVLLAIATGWRLVTRYVERVSHDSRPVTPASDRDVDGAVDGAVTDGSGGQSDDDASPESALVWVPLQEE